MWSCSPSTTKWATFYLRSIRKGNPPEALFDDKLHTGRVRQCTPEPGRTGGQHGAAARGGCPRPPRLSRLSRKPDEARRKDMCVILLRTSRIRGGLRAGWQALFEDVDVVLSPPMPTVAFPRDHSLPIHLDDRTTIAFAGLVEREFGGSTPPPNL